VSSLLIVDDHAGFRSWAREVLEHEGFTVVGEAEDGAGAEAAVRELRPDVVLLDVRLPDMSGYDVARRVGHLAAVVLISSLGAADVGTLPTSTGARGFLPKSDLSGPALQRLLDEAAR